MPMNNVRSKVADEKYTLIVPKLLMLNWQLRVTSLIVGIITSAMVTTEISIFLKK
jgi:hypothetical protein